jgi:hypothetical protein
VPRFVAYVELELEADSPKDCGRCLKELADAARSVGFELKNGRVEPAEQGPPSPDGWTRYTP